MANILRIKYVFNESHIVVHFYLLTICMHTKFQSLTNYNHFYKKHGKLTTTLWYGFKWSALELTWLHVFPRKAVLHLFYAGLCLLTDIASVIARKITEAFKSCTLT